jgi:hypothetical protein
VLQNAAKFTLSKEWKEVKNAGFGRSIDHLHHHNWYQVEFGHAFELPYAVLSLRMLEEVGIS